LKGPGTLRFAEKPALGSISLLATKNLSRQRSATVMHEEECLKYVANLRVILSIENLDHNERQLASAKLARHHRHERHP
jgi:hypothetical protein